MSKTAKFFKISSLLVLGQLIAAEGFAQVGPLGGNPANHGGYFPCTTNNPDYCFNNVCGDACFCNIEAQYGNTYGAPYNVCWVDMSSKKPVNCKIDANLTYEEKGLTNLLCPETK